MKALTITVIAWACFNGSISAQPNCNVFKMQGDETCYEACMLATKRVGPQGSGKSQEKFDKAIKQCPTLDYAYFEKAVPFLKRGDFITWRKLIDKAVELNPELRLGYRGWCRYQFLRDYNGAIMDLERLDTLLHHNDIGYSINGDYHLNVAKALCYKAIGKKEIAIKIIEKQLAKDGYSPMPYDYLHLGVLKIETGQLRDAIVCLNMSIQNNNYLAEAYFYLGKIYREMGLKNDFIVNMEKAKSFYLSGKRMIDPYTTHMDKVYFSQIEKELELHKK